MFIIDFLANGSPSAGAVSLVQTITDATFTDTYNSEVTYAQSGDVMFLCHQTYMPRKLTRTSLTTFAVSTYAFDKRSDDKRIYQPYNSFHPLDICLLYTSPSPRD